MWQSKKATISTQTTIRKTAENSTQHCYLRLPILEMSNDKFKTMTGISKDLFDLIIDITEKEIKDSPGFTKRQKVASVFIKLKLNPPYNVIAIFFDVSRHLIRKNLHNSHPNT